MSQPAARVGDMHVCPMMNPGGPPTPHVGGPITTPASPKVLIGGVPAAGVGSVALCSGPPDSVITGSSKVFIGNKPAARMGDSCSHGGKIAAGCAKVLIA